MEQKFYVMLGMLISSRNIKDKEAFQKKLEKACDEVNKVIQGRYAISSP